MTKHFSTRPLPRGRRLLATIITTVALVGGVVAGTPASADVVDDGIAPVLLDVEVLTHEIGAGGMLRVSYGMESDQPLLGPESFLEFSGIGVRPRVPLAGLPLSGIVEFAVPSTLPNQRYQLIGVSASEEFSGPDGVVRRTAYFNNLSGVTLTPPDMPQPQVHPVNMARDVFTFSGSTVDPTTPKLLGLSVSPKVIPASGGTVRVRVDVSEPLSTLRLVWGPDYYGLVEHFSSVEPGETLTLTFPAGYSQAPHALRGADLADLEGNSTSYSANTWTSRTWWGVEASGTHRVSLSAADFNLGTPPAPKVLAYSANGRTVVKFEDSRLDTFNPTGWVVSVSPGGATAHLDGSQNRLEFASAPIGVHRTVSVRMVSGAGSSPTVTAVATARDVHRIFGSNWDKDGVTDIMAADSSGRLWFYRGTGRGTFAGPPTKVGASGWNNYREMAPVGGPQPLYDRQGNDLTLVGVDGFAAKVYRFASGLRLEHMPAFSYSGFRQVLFPGKFDNAPGLDTLAIADNGDLWIGALGSGSHSRKIGSGWTAFPRVVAAGDVNGDLRPDVFGIRADGSMVVYLGNGHGGFLGGGRPVSNGWNRFAEIFSPGDFSGDQRADLVAVMPDGRAWLYRGNGNAGFTGSPTKIASNWSMFL